ncbi:hypothetical protein K432DRAFT_406706 [Lepidopterella palustris CBS 459.81]|uniref:Uncharacterized protein n=1 Tax=Lepidopterella palustris CBS 459.81 TaxID=1314670 RepID=A0A8E2E6A3_9PEZI|nr:hypothetical protein K432DRAFT_406706 [Lepidopterella palustris CBS 459.81]
MALTKTTTKPRPSTTTKRVSIALPPSASAPTLPSGIVYFWAFLGIDPYPYLAVLRGTEFLSCAVFIYLGNRTVIQPWRRTGVLSLDGKMFIGGMFASTLDILFAVFNPTWTMNAHGIAYGSWSNSIPGLPGPGAHKVPWGLLWCLPAYIWLSVGAAITGTNLLDFVWGRFPWVGRMGGYVLLQAFYMAVFTGLATFWNRTQVYTYVSCAPWPLTLWYGTTHQLPLYEPFLIGLYC